MANFNAKGPNAKRQERERPPWTALGVHNGRTTDCENLAKDLLQLTVNVWGSVQSHYPGEYDPMDLATDAYLGITTRIQNSEGRDSSCEAAAYCVTTIKNAAMGRWKLRRRRLQHEQPTSEGSEDSGDEPMREIEDTGRTPEVVGELAEMASVLHEALDEINPTYAEVVKLHYLDELEHSEIADELSISEANSRQRLSRGLRQLAIATAARGYALVVDEGTLHLERDDRAEQDGDAA